MTVRSPFETFWEPRFGATPPLGYRLRDHYYPRWLRIHSLPRGKRYAKSRAEHREVLARSNHAGTRVLGEGSRCWLVVPEYELDASKRVAELPAVSLAPALVVDEQDGDEPVTFWAAEVVWREGVFDDLLRAIADDRRRALWVAVDTSDVFVPYDGGVDLIVATPERRAALCDALKDWLSDHADGL